jgi:Ca2+-binding RTX toxin-like protein
MSGFNYSLAEAKELVNNATSIQDLIDIVRNTQATLDEYPASRVISLLYSGDVNGEPSFKVAQALADSTIGQAERYAIVDNTPVGELLFDGSFNRKLNSLSLAEAKATPGYAELSSADQARLQKSIFNKYFNNKGVDGARLAYDPANLSLWDIASKKFVEDAPGDLRMIGADADPNSIGNQTELPAALQKGKTVEFKFNGLDMADFKNATLADFKNAVLEVARMEAHFSGLSSTNLSPFRDWGEPQWREAMQNPAKLRDWFIARGAETPAEMAASEARVKSVLTLARQSGATYLPFLGTLLGALATGYQLYQIAKEAEVAWDRGDTEQATRIVVDGVLSMGAGFAVGGAVTGFLVGVVGGLALASPVGVVVGTIAAVGAGVAAGIGAEYEVKTLLDGIDRSAPVITSEGGWQVFRYASGVEVRQSETPSMAGIDAVWLVPDSSGHTLKIEQNSKTGEQTRSTYEGYGSSAELVSRETFTPMADSVVKVESVTIDKAMGTTTQIVEHRSQDDGTVLDFSKQIDFRDGSSSFSSDDQEGNTYYERLDADQNKITEEWHKGDGSHGEMAYNPDTGGISRSVTNADGSSVRSSDDGAGNTDVRQFDRSGALVAEQWNKFDGSHGSTVVAEDGTTTVDTFDRDGSRMRVVDDQQGNVQTGYFDVEGKLTGDDWQKADGSSGYSRVDDDGYKTSFVDDGRGGTRTTDYAPGGAVMSTAWNKADGSSGSEVYHPDGSWEGQTRNRDGSKDVYEADGQGGWESVHYSAGGEATGRSWQDADGGSGREIFKVDGTKIGEAVDGQGRRSRYSDDGKGNVSLTRIDADGRVLSTEWTQADGTHGWETVDAAGVHSGTVFSPNGTHQNYTNDENGNSTSRTYDRNGQFVLEKRRGGDGSYGESSYDDKGVLSVWTKNRDGKIIDENYYSPNGVVRERHVRPDGTERGMIDDGQGLRIVTDWGKDGVGIVGNTTIRYNQDGSGTVTTTDANGRVTERSFGPGELGPSNKPDTPPDPRDDDGSSKLDLPGPWEPSTGDSDPDGDGEGPPFSDPEDIPDNAPPYSERGWEQIKDLLYEIESSRTGRDSVFDKEKIDYIVGEYEKAEKTFQLIVSPLTLDLDRDGLETLAMSGGVNFDHDGNGFAEKSGWVAPDDGLLAYDRNGDGVISGGAELFGNYTPLAGGGTAANGFEALKDFDSNGDGKVDAADSNFASLRVWRDLNSNGRTDKGELLTLAEAGVAAISTSYEASDKVDSRNNAHRQLGQFTRTDGDWGQVHDVWFERDVAQPSDRSHTPYKPVPHGEAIDALPEIAGVGGMRNLRDAMALDPSLQAAVEAFVVAPSAEERRRLADTIIQKWTGADKAKFAVNSPYYNEQHLFALDVVSGAMIYDRNYNERPNAGPLANPFIENGYGVLLDHVTALLEKQAAAAYLSGALIDLRAPGSTIENIYARQKAQNPRTALRDLALLYQYMGTQLADIGYDVGGLLRGEAQRYSGDADMVAYLRTMHVFIGDGVVGDDAGWTPGIVVGGDGDDTLRGSAVRDILVGGKGDDLVQTSGEDIVMFGRGDGHDTIAAVGSDRRLSATIVLGSDIAPGDVTVSDSGTDVLLELSSGDGIRLANWNEMGMYFSVGAIRFADGTVWNLDDLASRLPALTEADDMRYGTPGSNVLAGAGGNDVLAGMEGDDVLDGGAGADTLSGGKGSDILLGGAGDDVISDEYNSSPDDFGGNFIHGGRGNDYISGSVGPDTYYFAIGDGADTIAEAFDFYGGVIDTLIFGPGIRTEDLVVRDDYGTLRIGLRNSSDVLSLISGSSRSAAVDRFVFDDGTVLGLPDLIAKASSQDADWLTDTDLGSRLDMLAGDDTVRGAGGNDTIDGGSGNDWVYGGDGRDQLMGGAGNDVLVGEAGDDTLIGGAGDDSLEGGTGNNTFVFGRGDGKDYVWQAGVYADEFDTILIDAAVADIAVASGGDDDNDLVLTIRDTGDSLTLDQWLTHGRYTDKLRIQFADGTVWTGAEIPMVGRTGDPTEGNDELHAVGGGALLEGRGGIDKLFGGAGDDTLDGGAGDDWLDGGEGADEYLFGYGSGHDIIREDGSTDIARKQLDTVRMGAGIRPQDVELSWDSWNGGTTWLRLKNANDVLEVIGQNSSVSEQLIERVVFEDGTVWDLTRNPADAGGGGAYTATVKGESIVPDATASQPASTVGYLFPYGSGHAVIGAEGDGAPPYDTIYLTNVSPSEVSLSWSGDTMTVRLAHWDDNDDVIEVLGQTSGAGGDPRIKRIVLNRFVWNLTADPARPIAQAAYELSITGTHYDDVLTAGDVSTQLVGDVGNDTLLGSLGDDSLDGGSGADLMDGGAGNDFLWVNEGDRVLFGTGSGADMVFRTEGQRATLVFKDGITPDDILLAPDDNRGLVVGIRGTEDRITLPAWFQTRFEDATIAFEFSDGRRWDPAAIRARIAQDDHTGEDHMYGGSGADLIDGGAGNDTIRAGAGDDTLIGGAGDDVLTGGSGLNVYRFERGFGRDTIDEDSIEMHEANRVVFGSGIRPQDIIVTGDNASTPGSSGNLYLSVFGGADKLTVRNWFNEYNRAVATFEFADGTVWQAADVLSRYYQLERGGHMVGSQFADTLHGDSTNDQIYGGGGNDTIDAGSGNDEMFGDEGNDVLYGGAGNDALFGGVGDDRYVFERGFGHDVVADFDRVNGSHDVIEFGAGIEASEVSVSRTGSDIVLTLAGGADSLSIRWYGNPGFKIEEIRFADGTAWTADDLQARADGTVTIRGTEGDDQLEGNDRINRIVGEAGNDRLGGFGGVDLLEGGDGDDTLDGGADADCLLGGAGKDLLDGGASADEMSGGGDDDTYVVDDADDLVFEAGGEGKDLVRSAIDYALPDNVEDLELTGQAVAGSGNALDNRLLGNAAGNLLYGGAGNDTLAGGFGDDQLDGGAGDDVYLYARGDGSDVISDTDGSDGNVDTVRFDASVSSADIKVTMDTGDNSEWPARNLYLTIEPTGEVITLQDWLAGTDSRIERVEFADGSSWDARELLRQATGIDNLVPGTDGDDFMEGGADAEWLEGRDGNDTLRGGAGDDTLAGGYGDDDLDGGEGSDTYVYTRGGNQDVILDSGDAADTDVLVFGDEINPSEISFRQGYFNSNDLVLEIAPRGEGDSYAWVTLKNWFVDGANLIDEIRFADGTVWSTDDIRALSGYQPATVITGTSWNDTLDGSDGADVLFGQEGDDTLAGMGGDDQLHGDAGNDVLDGGTGDDWLDGGAGDNVYFFRAGDGNDTIAAQWSSSGGTNRVRFADDIASDLVIVERSGNDLVLLNDADSITLENWFAGTGDRVELFEFADGTTWDAASIEADYGGGGTIVGTEYGEYLAGSDGDDMLLGLGGDDFIVAGSGNDTLDGGTGDDELRGADGDDVYLISRGDGVDYIRDNGVAGEGVDTLRFDATISPEDIALSIEYGNLVLTVRGSAQRVQIAEWLQASNRVEQIAFADGTVWDTQDVLARLPAPTDGDDNLVARPGMVLAGLAGDDTLWGLDGDDTLDGGAGADDLRGGAGSDLYLFGRGSGRDTVNEESFWDGSVDTLRIGAGVDPSALRVNRTTDGLLLTIAGTPDQVELRGWYWSDDGSIERVEFADGTVWGRDELIARITREGSPDNDSLVGDEADDLLRGLAGDDSLYGDAGNDTLAGGAGSDNIDGGDGNDLLDGGDGDDTLYGGYGSDTYSFGPGFGHDYLADFMAPGVDDLDRIRMQGIDPAQLVVSRDDYNLYLSLDGSADVLTLSNWFNDESSRNKRVEFDDGTAWDAEALEARIDGLHTSAGDDMVYGTEDGDVVLGAGGADSLYGNGGDDVLDGGDGIDYLQGGSGADVLRGSSGDDMLDDWDGGAIAEGGAGKDVLYLANAPGLLAGGAGDDEIDVSYTTAVIAFNRGDGRDQLYLDQADTVLSLNFAADEIALRREPGSADLLIETGETDSLRLVGWYTSENPSLTLQLIGADGVSNYDLKAVIAQFDAEGPASAWAVNEALPDYALAVEADHALGGELAYRYAMDGMLPEVSGAEAAALLADPDFGRTASGLAPASSIASVDMLWGSDGRQQAQTSAGLFDTVYEPGRSKPAGGVVAPVAFKPSSPEIAGQWSLTAAWLAADAGMGAALNDTGIGSETALAGAVLFGAGDAAMRTGEQAARLAETGKQVERQM